jgi:hypothetical protein
MSYNISEVELTVYFPRQHLLLYNFYLSPVYVAGVHCYPHLVPALTCSYTQKLLLSLQRCNQLRKLLTLTSLLGNGSLLLTTIAERDSSDLIWLDAALLLVYML